MKLKKILSEELGAYAPKSYPATSVPPRKDFVPYNKKDGYNYNRQANVDNRLASAPTPNSPIELPWQLNFVIDDLADAFIYLETAMQKISNCAKGSKVISKKQRVALMIFYKAIKKTAQVVKKVGLRIGDIANIAGQPTPDVFVPKAGNVIKRN